VGKKRRYRIPSAQQINVLEHILAHSNSYGYEIMTAINIGPGTLYGLLKRLYDDGYLQKSSSLVEGRNRINYQLSSSGIKYAKRAILEHEYEQGIKGEFDV